MTVINMQTMRYLNLLDRAARVKTSKCFVHNNTIFFAVNKNEVSKAIGPSAANIRNIQEKIGKKVRVVSEAEGIEDAKRFIEDITAPVKVRSLEVKDNCINLSAGSNQNKAVLIGRNKRRYDELRKIVQEYFGMDLKIV